MTCRVKDCGLQIHCKTLCLKHYEKKRRYRLKLNPCIACGVCATWRRNRCRQCYKILFKKIPHCHIPKCYKPIFMKLKCQFHFRVQFEKCCICEGKIYSRNLCRKCYERRDVDACENNTYPSSCSMCTSNEFLNKLCTLHYKQLFGPAIHCDCCSLIAIHRGKCKNHI